MRDEERHTRGTVAFTQAFGGFSCLGLVFWGWYFVGFFSVVVVLMHCHPKQQTGNSRAYQWK